VPDAPGAWLLCDLGVLVFAVPPEGRAVADAVAAQPPADAPGVLAALSAPGFAAEGFAILDAAGPGLHVVLRGPATVAAGAETLTGFGAEPWLERVIPNTTVVRLTVPGGEWTLTRPPVPVAAGGTAAEAVKHVTEIPDPELSLPRAPAPASPPPLGLEPGLGLGRALEDPDAPTAFASPPVALPPTLSLELPDGSRAPLDMVVLVGRAPSVAVGAPPTRLVRLDGDGDVSRTHARVAVEGGTVVVTDLGSRNGTIVRIPGRPAQKLRDGEPTPVLVGTVIDFGGGLELNVRDD
jgi:hypothetical protein